MQCCEIVFLVNLHVYVRFVCPSAHFIFKGFGPIVPSRSKEPLYTRFVLCDVNKAEFAACKQQNGQQ